MQKKTIVQIVTVPDVENVIGLLEAEIAVCEELVIPYKYAGAAEDVRYYEGQKRAYGDAIRYLKDMLVCKQYIEG